jgi:hypothetical protein
MRTTQERLPRELTVRACWVPRTWGFVWAARCRGSRNVEVSHCTFIGTDVDCASKAPEPGRSVENINIHDTHDDIPAEASSLTCFTRASPLCPNGIPALKALIETRVLWTKPPRLPKHTSAISVPKRRTGVSSCKAFPNASAMSPG